jgi:DNA-binding response OmpR family regulator
MRILLVEDDKDLADMYKMQLAFGGHKVRVAADAQAALDVLDNHPVDIIVLDIMLPTHNGLSVLYELRSYSDWKKLPVVVLSNLAAEEIGVSRQALRSLGIKHYLNKTHTKAAQLLEAVESAASG